MKLMKCAEGYKGTGHEEYVFHCPGCKHGHSFVVKRAAGQNGPTWTFNGNIEKPSFQPSLLYNGHPEYKNPTVPRCHLFLTDGVIHFLADCEHELAGKSVPLEPMD